MSLRVSRPLAVRDRKQCLRADELTLKIDDDHGCGARYGGVALGSHLCIFLLICDDENARP